MNTPPRIPLRFVNLLAVVLLLPACQAPLPIGGNRSVYGDKAGPRGFSTVIIDAGHGGTEPGARARGLVEKNLALDIARRLQSELRPGFKTVLVRQDDRTVPLDDRVRIANRHGDGVLVSVHLNYSRRRIAGPETYWWRTDSYSLAKRVQHHLNHTAPSSSGNHGLVRRRLRLTRNPQIPCILVECGYLTNSREASLLATARYRDRLAGAIAEAIREQAAHGDRGAGPLPKPIYAPPSRATDARG